MWNNIGNKLIAMAQDFPEDKYDFKVQKDQRTFAQTLLHVAGVDYLAVLLASIGIYGLLAYMVGQRSREIGIRMALGARWDDILRMFLRKGVALAGVGIVAGLVFSASTASIMAALQAYARQRQDDSDRLLPSHTAQTGAGRNE
jgi:ABC-type antimicrobial peptide transport system permease subunit